MCTGNCTEGSSRIGIFNEVEDSTEVDGARASEQRPQAAVSTRGRNPTSTHWGHQNNLSSYNSDLPIKRAVFTPCQARTRKGLSYHLDLA